MTHSRTDCRQGIGTKLLKMPNPTLSRFIPHCRRTTGKGSRKARVAATATVVLGGCIAAGALQAQPQTRHAAIESGRVAADVFDVYSTRVRARVIVVFDAKSSSSAPPASQRRMQAIERVREDILAAVPASQYRVKRRFRAVSAMAIEISEPGLFSLIRDPRVRRVGLDAPGDGHLAEGLPLAEVDAFKSQGFSGQGVTVAVLDSGYDSDHADLSDNLVGEQCFCSDNGDGCCPNGSETQSGSGSAEDDHGHGTNVTGIITSKGTVAPEGAAPDADIVAIKVLDENQAFCCSSDVVAGLDWIIAERPEVDVVNMSLGTFALFSGNCDDSEPFTEAFADAVDTLRANGVIVFASSGNDGSDTQMSAPACVENTVATGAVWDANLGAQTFLGCTDSTTAADQVTCFSNSNDTTDLFAPGAFITSTGPDSDGISTFGGTSQASPMAAGCAALLLEKAPGVSPDRIEAVLEASPTSVTDPGNGLSFPRLDCADAGNQCLEPDTLDLTAGQMATGTTTETACLHINAGPYQVTSTGDATFQAGESISLHSGFSVATGGRFTATIDPLLVPPSPGP